MRGRGAWLCVATVACVVSACSEPELQCSVPSGSIAAEGEFEASLVGMLASFSSADMRVRVTPRAEDDGVDVWACEQRGEDVWTVELSLSPPSTGSLPTSFGAGGGARVSGVVTGYEGYQLSEDLFGEDLSGTVSGSLSTLDVLGALRFEAVMREPCPQRNCQDELRTLDVQADLTWEP